MIAVYAWNAMPIDSTDIVRSIPAIGRPLRFQMELSIAALPTPINNAARATVRCLQGISSDSRFACDLVMWLTEERRERHRECLNTSKQFIQYNIGDMVMARVQVKSDNKTSTVDKLSIEPPGLFRIVTDHNNGLYLVQPFDKSDSAIRKFLAQDMYELPPQILPCDPIDIPDLRYLNTEYAPVKHAFKTVFDIKGSNIMWFEQHPPSINPPLAEICSDSLPPKIVTDHVLPPVSAPRPDTIDEMTIAFSDNAEPPLTLPVAVPTDSSG